MPPPRPKSVLITGCSNGGIGHALALEFHARGLVVFASTRNPAKMSALSSLQLPNMHFVTLDVTDAVSVAAAVKTVTAKTSGKLDYLVNNSGRGYTMPGLDVDVEEAKKMFDVNFWGVVRMVGAFAAALAASKGCVVNIGSGAGMLGLPYMSIYNASKAALHLFDDTLRLEVAPLGIRVLTVVTGAVSTAFGENSPMPELPPESKYQGVKSNIEAVALTTTGMTKTKVEKYAKKVVDDVLGGATGKTYRGASASLAWFVAAWVPGWILDRMLVNGSGLEKM